MLGALMCMSRQRNGIYCEGVGASATANATPTAEVPVLLPKHQCYCHGPTPATGLRNVDVNVCTCGVTAAMAFLHFCMVLDAWRARMQAPADG